LLLPPACSRGRGFPRSSRDTKPQINAGRTLGRAAGAMLGQVTAQA
jgi:hypothetical protein